jgi:serine/threonine protein kinase
MIVVSGYKIIESLDNNINPVVYRGIRVKDNQKVILKFLKPSYPTNQQINRYRREYEITSLVDSENVIKVYSLEGYENTLMMVLEDFDAIALSKFCDQFPLNFSLNLVEFLNLAISLSNGLFQIHQAGIIHKDINPSNIFYNPQTKQVKIGDFGLATLLNKENLNLKYSNILEGTLAYISPEQTGRMNRQLDYRTDFYSLGVTFYQLLTGKLPFDEEEALQLIHSHLAKQPLSFQQINQQNQNKIPEVIENIVFKLMAKTAEDRYQSAWGLKTDLEKCLHLLQNNGNIQNFSLGSQDICDQFQIPEKLYSRGKEIQELIDSFERVINKDNTIDSYHNELTLVSGYSGIGKSVLVREIYKPITEKKRIFYYGKI